MNDNAREKHPYDLRIPDRRVFFQQILIEPLYFFLHFDRLK
jgi:hypothetical protein